MKIWILLLGILISPIIRASCPEPQMGNGPVGQANQPILLLVHASTVFDPRRATAPGIEVLAQAPEFEGKIVQLKNGDPVSTYFTSRVSCEGDWRYSSGGEILFPIRATSVHMAGGHLEYCLNTALNDLIWQWAEHKVKSAEITLYANAIYSNGKLIEKEDAYAEEFNQFMQVLMYGKPQGEAWPKVTLLETLGAIKDRTLQYQYIKRILPRFDTSMLQHTVEVAIEGYGSEIVQQGSDPDKKILVTILDGMH